jgi:hypothetical protein
MPAADPTKLIIPSRGLIYKGDVDATPPAASALASLSDTVVPTGPGNWVCLGHTSRENLPAYNKDGGDVNTYGSWFNDAIDSTTDPTTWSVTINALQSDATTLGLAFGGGTYSSANGTFDVGTVTQTPCSLLILMIGGTKRRALYHPNTLTSLGDAPEIAVDSYFELQLQASLLNSAGTTTASTAAAPAGWAGKFWRFIDPALIVAP